MPILVHHCYYTIVRPKRGSVMHIENATSVFDLRLTTQSLKLQVYRAFRRDIIERKEHYRPTAFTDIITCSEI